MTGRKVQSLTVTLTGFSPCTEDDGGATHRRPPCPCDQKATGASDGGRTTRACHENTSARPSVHTPEAGTGRDSGVGSDRCHTPLRHRPLKNCQLTNSFSLVFKRHYVCHKFKFAQWFTFKFAQWFKFKFAQWFKFKFA